MHSLTRLLDVVLYSETWEETREFLTKYATDVNTSVSLLVHWHNGEKKSPLTFKIENFT